MFGINVSRPSNQSLVFSNTALNSDYQAVLSQVLFQNTDDEPGNGNRTVLFSFVDGTFESYARAFVEIVPTNDPAFFNFDLKRLTFDESPERVPIPLFDSSDVISDSDGDTLESVAMEITLTFDPQDMLGVQLGDSGLSAVFNTSRETGNLVLNISGQASLEVYQAVLQAVRYFNPYPDIMLGDRVVEVTTFDGFTVSPPHLIVISILPFDDPPICYFTALVSLTPLTPSLHTQPHSLTPLTPYTASHPSHPHTPHTLTPYTASHPHTISV